MSVDNRHRREPPPAATAGNVEQNSQIRQEIVNMRIRLSTVDVRARMQMAGWNVA
jgi:hypothetical protein